MSASSTPSVATTVAGSPARPLAAIFWGGLLAGIFDITQAFIGFGLSGAKPYRILQHIAGGVFGARSMQMGWTSALLGLMFHFTIAFEAAAVYYFSAGVARDGRIRGRVRPDLRRNGVPVHVFRGAAAHAVGTSALFYGCVHYGANWPHGLGGVANRAVCATFWQVVSN